MCPSHHEQALHIPVWAEALACGEHLAFEAAHRRAAVEQQVPDLDNGRNMPGASYRTDEYEAIVREVLADVSLGAEHIAAVVGETRDAEPDRLAIARIGRERDAALARYRRDRDLRALERTMAALDE